MGSTDVFAAVFSMVLPNGNRRDDSRFRLAVPGDRSPPSLGFWIGGRCRVDRGYAPLGRGPEQTTGGATLGRCETLVAWWHRCDVRVGDSLVSFRIDQGLLQHSLLGEDVVAVSGASFYLHGLAPHDADKP